MTGIVWRANMNQRRCVFALSVVFVGSLPAIAGAEVHVEGSQAVVRVSTSRDTISDVLSALAATFDVRYRTAISLDAAADGTYSGSLQQVISRLLDGYNYMVKSDDSKTTEIVVFGTRGKIVSPPKAPMDEPEVERVQYNIDEPSDSAVILCMSMGKATLGREPSKKRVISRTYTCIGDRARNLKLIVDRETKETLEALARRHAPGGARAKTIEYDCPETDKCMVIVKY
jgi:hypothetical protein